jgi:hypothetical protein
MEDSMKRNSRKRSIKIIASILTLIILGAVALVFAAFSGSNYKIPDTLPSLDVLEKVRIAQLNEGAAAITSNDINGMIQFTGFQKIEKSGITVNGIYVEINNGKLTVYSPVMIKGYKFLISSKFDLSYGNDNYIVTPTSFKLGKLPIPKSFVLSKLKSYLPNGIELKNESLYVNRGILPFNTKSLTIKDDKIYLALQKDKNVENGVASNSNAKVDNNSSNNAASNNAANSNGNASSNQAKGTTQNSASKENNSLNIKFNYFEQDNSIKPNRKVVLNKAKGQLAAAVASCKSSGEKQIISIGQKVLSKMISNPKYNYSADAGEVRAIYNKLTQEQQTQLKNAVLSHLNVKEVVNAVYSK